MDEHETRRSISSASCCQRLLFFGRLLLHLGCLGYSLCIILLLAYLKDNPYYWLLGSIPFIWNLFFPILAIVKNSFFRDNICGSCAADILSFSARTPAVSVVIILMTCFTMLTRLAYYHRQPDEFIGPRFIIMSLQGSIILIFLDFYLQGGGKLESLLNCKDTMTRVLLDFFDIFNMVEMLSANQCVRVGSFVSENSHTERSIQAFCTMSFKVILYALVAYRGHSENLSPSNDDNPDQTDTSEPGTPNRRLVCVTILFASELNFPFLVIRIVVWARYNLYSLGLLVKNVIVIVMAIALCVKEGKDPWKILIENMPGRARIRARNPSPESEPGFELRSEPGLSQDPSQDPTFTPFL